MAITAYQVKMQLLVLKVISALMVPNILLSILARLAVMWIILVPIYLENANHVELEITALKDQLSLLHVKLVTIMTFLMKLKNA